MKNDNVTYVWNHIYLRTNKVDYEILHPVSGRPVDQVVNSSSAVLVWEMPYWEPAKWLARMRATRTDSSPLILKTDMGAGHRGASGRYDKLLQNAFDFAFVVEHKVKAADIVRAAQGVDRKLIAGVNVFDVYEGRGIEPGKKSIAIAVTLQPREKTLTDQEIEALGAKIVAEVGKRTGGVLRT